MDEATRSYSYRGPVSDASAAGRLMYEAIDLAMEDKSPFPDRSTFIDADTPAMSREIEAAIGEGQSAVVVSADGSSRVISPGESSPSTATRSDS